MSDLDDDELRATRILNKVEKEIEVGEYVRSLVNGRIFKVLEISDLIEEPNVKYYKTGNLTGFCSTELYQVKHSFNIIDLIEVGDYVNGSKVIDIAQGKTKAAYIESQEQKFALIPIVEKQIKSIVTKEQFASMEYKVKE